MIIFPEPDLQLFYIDTFDFRFLAAMVLSEVWTFVTVVLLPPLCEFLSSQCCLAGESARSVTAFLNARVSPRPLPLVIEKIVFIFPMEMAA